MPNGRPNESGADTLPSICETDCSKCSGYLMSNEPCRAHGTRGCPLRHRPGYRLITGEEAAE